MRCNIAFSDFLFVHDFTLSMRFCAGFCMYEYPHLAADTRVGSESTGPRRRVGCNTLLQLCCIVLYIAAAPGRLQYKCTIQCHSLGLFENERQPKQPDTNKKP